MASKNHPSASAAVFRRRRLSERPCLVRFVDLQLPSDPSRPCSYGRPRLEKLATAPLVSKGGMTPCSTDSDTGLCSAVIDSSRGAAFRPKHAGLFYRVRRLQGQAKQLPSEGHLSTQGSSPSLQFRLCLAQGRRTTSTGACHCNTAASSQPYRLESNLVRRRI